jgi:hypothetical protein
MAVKKIKKLFKYYILGESLKEIEMNRILEKINKKQKLTIRESNFLELYNYLSDDDTKDLMYLSKNKTFDRIKDLLKKNKTIICDLFDRDGKIGLPILSIENNFEDDDCKVYIKGGYIHNLSDRFLYNIIYNLKRDQYSLQQQDEYFEKIESKND